MNFVIPFISVLSLWFPVIYEYKSSSQLNVFRSIGPIPVLPDERTVALLQTVDADPNSKNATAKPSEIVVVAEQLLLGKINLGGLGVDTESLGSFPVFHPPFDEGLILKGNSFWQLAYSSFLLPSIFLRAFDATGQENFLIAARDFILGWWEFERGAVLPKGFLWNDHAVASRAMVLSEFWYRYRNHRLFNAPNAQAMVDLAENTARLLSRANLYTYRTNHGFMQNVGLAKLSLSFPGTRKMEEYAKLSFQRMLEQIEFFFDEDGVVLEHSPGYHVFGMELLDDLIALMKAAGHSVPASVIATRKKSLAFLRRIVRPDGTLPRIGDTYPREVLERYPNRVAAWADDGAGLDKNRRIATVIFGKSGYAIHRKLAIDRSPTTVHLTAFWGYLPHMGHKHADELSLHYWAGGTDWWTAVGYWPYTRSDRLMAICWDGSNAPHLIGETCGRSARTARALSAAQSEVGFALDLLREGPEGFRVRRQIVSLTDGVKLTVDSFDDSRQRQARIVWLSDPTNRVAKSGNNYYRLESAKSLNSLSVQFLSSDGTPVRSEFGDPGSTIGWVADRDMRPAPAFVVELPSQDSWSLNVSVLETNKQVRFAGDAKMIYWRGPETWEIAVPLREGTLTIQRTRERILIRDGALGAGEILTMKGVSASDQVDQFALQAYKNAESRYGIPFDPFIKYRLRITWLLMIMTFVHFMYLLGLSRLGDRAKLYGLVAPIVGWPVLMTWLFTVYFVA